MEKDSVVSIEEYEKLQEKYDYLFKKYSRVNNRLETIIKLNDMQLTKNLELLASQAKENKRAKSIIKHSDKQLYKLINEINEYAKINNRFEVIVKHSDKQERKILQKKNTLEKKLEEELALNQENQKLLTQQAKLAAMGEMIENIAHQMKQPLSVITTLTSANRLNIEFDTMNNSNLDKDLELIEESVAYLSNTINDFKNFFDENKFKKNFLIENVLNKAEQLLFTKFNNSNIELIKRVDEVNMHGVSNELIQVIMNIYSNAIDVLSSKEGKRYIFIDTKIKDNICELCFLDNGGGVKEEAIETIFDAHFTTKENHGSGIGLYMSKKILENSFNAKITVKNREFSYNNEKLKGAEFCINIPFKVL